MSTMKQVSESIESFARNNHLQIHPGKTATKWAALVIKEHGCPCVPNRDTCPCPEALTDIAAENCCRCRLFVNDGYIQEYNRLRARRKK